MANNDAPRGLTPVRALSGAPFSASALTKCYYPSSDSNGAAYVGGVVKLTGTGDSNGIPEVTANCSATDVLYGVIVGFLPTPGSTGSSKVYREDATERYVLVCTDPYMMYEIQEDSVGGALAATDIGTTCQLTGLTGGSTVTGRSSMELDSSEVSATADADDDVFIHQLVQAPDNEIGTNARWLVTLNNTVHKQSATGV
jgi:hypothetical protein